MEKNIYFTEKAKTSSDTGRKSETGSGSDTIHHANRDNDDYEKHRSKTWTFLEFLSDSYSNNKVYFVTGFVMAVLMCTIAIMNDPQDRYGAFEYVRELEERPGREIDKTYGYERALRREKELHPDLKEA